MADEDAAKEGGQSPGDGAKPRGGFSFVPRWRKHAASQIQPVDTPSVGPEPAGNTGSGVHPNLQKQPEGDSGKKFQPRWRQRAAEAGAQKATQEPALEQESSQPQPAPEKTGFQPRWRRTAAPAPTPEAPLEPQPKEEKGFQPKWRQRAERTPAAPPPPRPEFTPRWKRNLAEAEASPVGATPTPPPIGAEVPTSPAVEERVPAQAEVEVELAQTACGEAEPPVLESEIPEAPAPGADTPASITLELKGTDEGIDLVGAAQTALAEEEPDHWFGAPLPEEAEAPSAFLNLKPEPEPEPEPEPVPAPEPAPEPALTQLPAPEASGAPIALAASIPLALSPEPEEIDWPEAAVEEVEPVVPSPPPANEKRRLPRPQPPPVPKPAVIAAPISQDPLPPPDTESVLAPLSNPAVPAPKSSLLKFLPSPDEDILAVPEPEQEPAPELPPTEKKPVRRLDDEAMAALKATASMLTAPNRMPATPPPPPPPPAETKPVASTPPAATSPDPTPVPSAPRPAPGRPRYVPTPAGKPTQSTATPKGAQKPKGPRREPVVATEEVATFTRQFSVMVGAGLPIHQALSFLAESTPGPLGKVIDQVATKISSGLRLSVALSHFPGVFSEVYLGLIELGETSSHIEEALGKLADLLEKQVGLAKRLQSALIYPAFLVAASMAAVGVFLQYVLPTMIPLFQSFSMTLPWPTRVLLYSRHLVWPSVITVGGLLALWRWFQPAWVRARRRKEPWARKVDALTLKLPLFGKLLLQIAVARVLFALATMIETGLPILNALHRCESVASNLEFATRLEKAGEELRDGSTVTDALALYNVLPASCIHLISAGEESAQMAEMVQYAARYYEEEVDHSISQFMSLVEPVIMCVMGIVVAFIVLSAVLPTVEMINHLGG